MERRRHGAVLRALASWTWRHIGVEFVIGSYVNAPKLFLQVLCFFLPPQKPTLHLFQFDWKQ